MCELSEVEYNICMMAVMKCHLLNNIVKSGLPCTLTSKTFGFVTMTDEEENALVEKLYNQSQIAWLRDQR